MRLLTLWASVGVCALILTALHPKPSAAQRLCCKGGLWLQFDDSARQRYVEGYILGYSQGQEDGCDDAAKRHDVSADDCGLERIQFSKEIEFYSNSLTMFYTRYPDARDLNFYEILQLLGQNLSLEQIHTHPFMRHDPPLLTSANPARQDFAKYKPVEAYEIRPGILMMPRYAVDGRVCEIGIQKLHYSTAVVQLDSGLSQNEIDQIFEELVPADQRGPKSTNTAGDLITQSGGGLITTIDYENVSIKIYGATSPGTHKRDITANDVAATLKWKNRTCR
jgi:hypothetical protein